MNEPLARRLLIPIAAATKNAPGIDYARRCRNAGWPIEACLLHVIAPVDAWQVLRFLKQAEVVRFQEQRAADCLLRHAALLAAEDIPFRTIVRRGRLIESIVGVADELDCSEVVVPAPSRSVWGCSNNRLVAGLARNGLVKPLTLMH